VAKVKAQFGTVEYVKTHENGATETMLAETDANGAVLVHLEALDHILGLLGFVRVFPE
jgi:hypothetical protein